MAHESQERSDQSPQTSLAPLGLLEDASYAWLLSSSIVSGFCPYQSALPKTVHGHGFEDSTGQGLFTEANPHLRK